MTALTAIVFWLSFAALLWTYLGYPFLTFVRATIRPRPIYKSEAHLPALTLLIPAYNEADVIRRKLENSVSLDYPPDLLQILVVDSTNFYRHYWK